MFKRGSKIVITKSSAHGKSHPAVGDVGYLSDMHLFLVHRFILLEAFFHYYKSDKGRNKNRCERKHFIIDLGMKESFKKRLIYEGLNFSFLTGYYKSICLFPTIAIPKSTMISIVPDTQRFWYRRVNNKSFLINKQPLKIPYGQIALVNMPKNRLNEVPPAELKCWMQCQIPVLNTILLDTGTLRADRKNHIIDYLNSNNLVDSLNSSLDTVLLQISSEFGGYSFRSSNLINNDEFMSTESESLVRQIKLCEAIGKNVLIDSENYLIRNIVAANSRIYRTYANAVSAFIRDINRCDSITDAYKRASNTVMYRDGVKFITNVFFRRLFDTKPNRSNLEYLLSHAIIPWKITAVRKRLPLIEDIVKKAGQCSSSLNRLFDENLGV